jgi:hypothetical protein
VIPEANMIQMNRKAQKTHKNKFLDLYRRIFAGDDGEVRAGIMKIQAAARQYVPEEAIGRSVGIGSTSLDKTIAETYGLKMALSAQERKALVGMLVTYHDLRSLKPWNDSLMPAMW